MPEPGMGANNDHGVGGSDRGTDRNDNDRGGSREAKESFDRAMNNDDRPDRAPAAPAETTAASDDKDEPAATDKPDDRPDRAAGPPGIGAPPSAPDQPDQAETDDDDDNKPASAGGLFGGPAVDSYGNPRSTSPVADRINNTVSYDFDEVGRFLGRQVQQPDVTPKRSLALAEGAAVLDGAVVMPSPREQISLYQSDLRLQQRGLEYQRAKLGENVHPRSPNAAKAAAIDRQLGDIQARRDALDNIAMPDLSTGLTPEILHFDPREDGQVVVAYGDIRNATHIGVMVPGMTTDLNSFPLTNERVQDLMLALSDEAGVNPAVIGYLGYDAPDNLAEAVFDDQAVQGGPAFAEFLDGLPEHANTQVLAHSYGSLLTGRALAEGARPDVVHIFGSPGIGVDSVDELNLDGMTVVTSTENPGDLVSWSERFGEVPPEGAVELPAMGQGHSEYFDERVLVDIVLGRRQPHAGGQ